jgi:hypothetical protein
MRSAHAALMLAFFSVVANGQDVIPPHGLSRAEKRDTLIEGQPYILWSKLSKANPNNAGRVLGIMDLNFTYNYHHNTGKAAVAQTLDRLAATEGWTVTHFSYQDLNNAGVDDRARVNLAELSKNLVVVANNISSWAEVGQSTNPQLNRAIERYIADSGGSLFLIHGSGESFSNSSWTYYRSSIFPPVFDGTTTGALTSGFISPEAVDHPAWRVFRKSR